MNTIAPSGQAAAQAGMARSGHRSHFSAMTLPSGAGARAIMPKGHVMTHMPHAMQACLPPTFVTTSSGERCIAWGMHAAMHGAGSQWRHVMGIFKTSNGDMTTASTYKRGCGGGDSIIAPKRFLLRECSTAQAN